MTPASFSREIFAALAEELGVVVGVKTDSTATVASGAATTGSQWIGDLRVEAPADGTLTVAIDHDGAAALARVVTGAEGDLADEVLGDTLRSVLAQAVSGLALKPVARGTTLSVHNVTRTEPQPLSGEWAAFVINSEKLSVPVAVTVSGALSVAMPASPPDAAIDDRIEVLLDIDLPLVVRFGRTELPLRELTRLGPGSVIDLGRSPDDPVEVLVSNRVVARGEVVVVSGNYGIRILDVVSQRERARSLEV